MEGTTVGGGAANVPPKEPKTIAAVAVAELIRTDA
jgi:hypothetical protein